MIDIHCHILPGLDDGPKNMEKAVGMARAAVESGTSKIIATPHFRNGVYDVESEMITASVELFSKELAKMEIPLEIIPGAEIRISSDICALLDQGELPCLGHSRYYLIELPDIFIKDGIIVVLRQLWQQGVVPVIAHPERNRTIKKHPGIVREFVFEHALLQVTGQSLTGENGKGCFRVARDMIKEGLAHFVASDGHDLRYRPPCLDQAYKMVKKTEGEKTAITLFRENPAKILERSASGNMKVVG